MDKYLSLGKHTKCLNLTPRLLAVSSVDVCFAPRLTVVRATNSGNYRWLICMTGSYMINADCDALL